MTARDHRHHCLPQNCQRRPRNFTGTSANPRENDAGGLAGHGPDGGVAVGHRETKLPQRFCLCDAGLERATGGRRG
eukprot:11169449-Lingulodinium_polyedra.AAC.1